MNQLGTSRLKVTDLPSDDLDTIQQARRPAINPALLFAAGVVVIALVGVLSAAITSQLRPTPAAATICDRASAWLDVIGRQEQSGQWRTAAANALTASSSDRLCEIDRPVLLQKALSDTLEAIYDDSDLSDLQNQRQVLQQYQDLRVMAEHNALSIPGPATVARRLYQSQAFLAARGVWEIGFADGSISAADRAALRDYASTLRNLAGVFHRQTATPEAQRQALAILVTCRRVVDQYRLPVMECDADLREFAPDPSSWPPPDPSPLI